MNDNTHLLSTDQSIDNYFTNYIRFLRSMTGLASITNNTADKTSQQIVSNVFSQWYPEFDGLLKFARDYHAFMLTDLEIEQVNKYASELSKFRSMFGLSDTLFQQLADYISNAAVCRFGCANSLTSGIKNYLLSEVHDSIKPYINDSIDRAIKSVSTHWEQMSFDDIGLK